MKGGRLLVLLIALAAAVSGWIYGLHWKSLARGGASANDSASLRQLDELVIQLEDLERENASLRSLAQGGGDVPVEQEMLAFVSGELGLDFASTPRVQRVTPEDMADAVRDELAHIFGGPEGMDRLEAQWMMLGLVSPEQRIWAQVIALKSNDARGVRGVDAILVAPDFDAGSVADASALVQLLAESLVRGEMAGLPDEAGFDQVLAREATVYGLCDKVVAAFRAKQARRFGSIGEAGVIEEDESEMSFSPWALELTKFPFREGRNAVERRLSGGESIAQILAAPAESTAEIVGAPAGDGWTMGLAMCRTLLGGQEEPLKVQGDSLFLSTGESIVWEIMTPEPKKVTALLEPLYAERFSDDPEIPEVFRRVYRIVEKADSVVIATAPNEVELERVLPE